MTAAGKGDIVCDLTLGLSGRTLTYPGDPPPEIERVADIARGDVSTTSHLSVNCHVGTHVDAPAHFLADGATLDDLSLDRFYGPAIVLDMRGRNVIRPADLEAETIRTGCHVLLKTDNSRLLRSAAFGERYCALSHGAAEYLCGKRPRSVGFDYYSVDPYGSDDFPAHRVLARASIPVFVCLDLSAAEPGEYVFSGLPLRLEGAEASPVRAVLMAS